MIKYIRDESRKIPANLNVLVEILYCEQHGIEEKPDLRYTGLLSESAAAWAGFSRRDPFVQVPKYPPHSFLSEVLHTFSSIAMVTESREKLARIIAELPEIPA